MGPQVEVRLGCVRARAEGIGVPDSRYYSLILVSGTKPGSSGFRPSAPIRQAMPPSGLLTRPCVGLCLGMATRLKSAVRPSYAAFFVLAPESFLVSYLPTFLVSCRARSWESKSSFDNLLRVRPFLFCPSAGDLMTFARQNRPCSLQFVLQPPAKSSL